MKTMPVTEAGFPVKNMSILSITGVLALIVLTMAGCARDVTSEQLGRQVSASTVKVPVGPSVFDVTSMNLYVGNLALDSSALAVYRSSVVGACYAEGVAKSDDPYKFCDSDISVPAWTSTACLSQTLIGDNGVKNGGVSGGNQDFVTCIQPSAYPSFLTGINGLSLNANGTDQAHYVVYKTQEADSAPLLPAVWTSENMVVPHNAWQHVDLTGQYVFDTPITSGSWCIGVNTPSGTDIYAGQTYPRIGKGYWTIDTDDYMSHYTSYDLSYRGETKTCPECACYIDGVCYREGTARWNNICQECRAAVAVDMWSSAEGKSCSDGLFCNGTNDSCSEGVCAHPGNDCDPQCQQCNEVTDACDNMANFCDADSDGCTVDICQTGACVVGSAPDCSASGDACNVAVCSSTGNISYECVIDTALKNGQDCDDGNACTLTDICQTGVCIGADPLVCTPQDVCHNQGVCNVATGICTNPAKNDWESCADDGMQACFQGVCEASQQNDTCASATVLIEGVSQDALWAGYHAFRAVPDSCIGVPLSGIDAFYTFTYEAGKAYTLTVTPDASSDAAVVVWGDCLTTDSCQIGMNSDMVGAVEILSVAGRPTAGSFVVQVLSITIPDSETSGFSIVIEEGTTPDGDNQVTENDVMEDVASVEDVVTPDDLASHDSVVVDVTPGYDLGSNDLAGMDITTGSDSTGRDFANLDTGTHGDTTGVDGGSDEAVPSTGGGGCGVSDSGSPFGVILVLLALVAITRRFRFVLRNSGLEKKS